MECQAHRTLPNRRKRRWEGEDKKRVKTYLHLNVQNARPALLRNVFDGLETGAVEVASKLRMLNESAIGDQVLELVLGHKVVFLSMLLCSSRCACRV